MDVKDLKADVTELQALLEVAKRPAVRRLLQEKLGQLEKTIKDIEASEAAKAEPSKPVPKSAVSAMLPTVKLSSYGWDQSEKYVKIYVTLAGVKSIEASNIDATFTSHSFDVFVRDLSGKNYTFTIKDLMDEIDLNASIVKQKSDSLLVMLRKKNTKQWDALTRTAYLEKEKNKPKFDSDAGEDPQAGLMSMMKQMYETGDDEMKRSIRKAWHEGQSKKGSGGGMPDGLF